jgi:hypothetical protein
VNSARQESLSFFNAIFLALAFDVALAAVVIALV